MKPLPIRQRILVAALVPALLVALLVTWLLIAELRSQAHVSQHQRLDAIARQTVALAAFDLFVGNHESLLKLLQAVQQDPDIQAAAIVDMHNQVVASTIDSDQLPDTQDITHGFSLSAENESIEHWHVIPIHPVRALQGDLFPSVEGLPAESGHLLLKVTNAALKENAYARALESAAVAGIVVLLALLLAWALSRRLIGLLTRIRHVVEQTGRGIGGARIRETADDELGQLASGIDRMIERVELSQAELSAMVFEATNELRQEKEAAETAMLARGRFFAAASHDLRQPVQALSLFASRLEEEAGDSPLRHPLHKLGQSARSLQRLLETLLDYSRLDGQVYRVEWRAVNASRLLAELVEDFAIPAAEKGIVLRCRCKDGWIMTDPALLRRLLINLLNNALRHTRQGSVLVACRHRGPDMRIEIWDTGPGIPVEQQAAIFEELVQLDNPERDPEKGLGIGLAIVRRTADLLHHPLSLCSRPGHGSCFSVRAPLTSPPADPVPQDSQYTVRAERILILDPTGMSNDVQTFLGRWQLAAQPVVDVAAVRDAYRETERPPRLLLMCAAGLPEIEQAMQSLDRLEREIGHALPTLFITDAPVSPTVLGEMSGQRLLVSRPFQPARLRSLINRLLDPLPNEQ